MIIYYYTINYNDFLYDKGLTFHVPTFKVCTIKSGSPCIMTDDYYYNVNNYSLKFIVSKT